MVSESASLPSAYNPRWSTRPRARRNCRGNRNDRQRERDNHDYDAGRVREHCGFDVMDQHWSGTDSGWTGQSFATSGWADRFDRG